MYKLKERTKDMTSVLTIEDLREIEESEYKSLKTLQEILYEKEAEDDRNGIKEMKLLVNYQRGRWGAFQEMIEKLEGENE